VKSDTRRHRRRSRPLGSHVGLDRRWRGVRARGHEVAVARRQWPGQASRQPAEIGRRCPAPIAWRPRPMRLGQALFASVTATPAIPALVVFNGRRHSCAKACSIPASRTFEPLLARGLPRRISRRARSGRARCSRVSRAQGHIIFTGATASPARRRAVQNLAVRKPRFSARARAKHGARAAAIGAYHVAHVVIDGQIEGERPGHSNRERGKRYRAPDPAAIAETTTSPSAAAQRVEVTKSICGPYVEKF